MGASGLRVDGGNLLGQLRVPHGPETDGADAASEKAARETLSNSHAHLTLRAACFSALDERVHAHPVPFAMKDVAPLEDLHAVPQAAVLPLQWGQFLAFAAGGAVPLADIDSACPVAHRGLGQVAVPGDLANRRITASAQLTISGVNERRGRGVFFPMLCVVDILPGTQPLASDCPPKWIKSTGWSLAK
ncbi:hypothetical protein ACFU53_36790 [Streptomyces sp. NPDC057474]|uniref:hypothetical protein n=1 Tax=Streptomyces sp. NPDC057474 TaxID=3346144 RepID=UPI00369C5897